MNLNNNDIEFLVDLLREEVDAAQRAIDGGYDEIDIAANKDRQRQARNVLVKLTNMWSITENEQASKN